MRTFNIFYLSEHTVSGSPGWLRSLGPLYALQAHSFNNQQFPNAEAASALMPSLLLLRSGLREAQMHHACQVRC